MIPHDFVVFGPEADLIHSLEDGRRLIWPEVADEFARVWQLTEPPPALVRCDPSSQAKTGDDECLGR